jgi:hypothetical protein
MNCWTILRANGQFLDLDQYFVDVRQHTIIAADEVLKKMEHSARP